MPHYHSLEAAPMGYRVPGVDQSLFYSNEGSAGKFLSEYNKHQPHNPHDRKATIGSDGKR